MQIDNFGKLFSNQPIAKTLIIRRAIMCFEKLHKVINNLLFSHFVFVNLHGVNKTIQPSVTQLITL